MSLRSLSNLSNPSRGWSSFGSPDFRQGIGQSTIEAGQPRLGGGKGMAGSFPQQANSQSQFLQQFLPMLLARRTQQMQAPAFMSPAQRLAQMPQQALPALTQTAPQPFFGAQPTAQAPMLPGVQAQTAMQPASQPAMQADVLPGVQAQQAAQVAAAQQAQPTKSTFQSIDTFDPAAYLQANPDVAAAGMDPWWHWTKHGAAEGRQFTYR